LISITTPDGACVRRICRNIEIFKGGGGEESVVVTDSEITAGTIIYRSIIRAAFDTNICFVVSGQMILVFYLDVERGCSWYGHAENMV
jgi:hypothetical protein